MAGNENWHIGLAALRHPESVEEGLNKIADTMQQAARQGVQVVCFPETYLPGLRGSDAELPPPDQGVQERALERVRQLAAQVGVAAIVGLEWSTDLGLHNRAYVLSAQGEVLGYQTKNQITPGGESEHYVPDGHRQIFEVDGVRFGIVICHEGWRYPETVRWAAVRGARIVFQPQWTGSDRKGRTLERWGESFYEKAMICRTQENSIYFASVNTAMRYQNSATCLVDPSGACAAWVPYGKETLLICDVDLAKADLFYARRYDPALYPSAPPIEPS
jgi:predicted amidohydrolase